LLVYREPKYVKWAEGWLSGTDRSGAAEAWAAAWAATWAAEWEAAEWAACAAAEWAACAAARAACAAADGSKIDLVSIIRGVVA
jgi:hypothetical protein